MRAKDIFSSGKVVSPVVVHQTCRRLMSLLPPLCAELLLMAPAATLQHSLINNPVVGTSCLVTDSLVKTVAGTNRMSHLLLDTPTGGFTVSQPASGLFSAECVCTLGVCFSRTHLLEKVGFGPTSQLEIRVWGLSLFPSYEAALQAGGVTVTSGLSNFMENGRCAGWAVSSSEISKHPFNRAANPITDPHGVHRMSTSRSAQGTQI